MKSRETSQKWEIWFWDEAAELFGKKDVTEKLRVSQYWALYFQANDFYEEYSHGLSKNRNLEFEEPFLFSSNSAKMKKLKKNIFRMNKWNYIYSVHFQRLVLSVPFFLGMPEEFGKWSKIF